MRLHVQMLQKIKNQKRLLVIDQATEITSGIKYTLKSITKSSAEKWWSHLQMWSISKFEKKIKPDMSKV